MNSCVICPRTLQPVEEADGLQACRACIVRLRAILRELPVQLAALEACLEPDGAPKTGSIHAARGSRLPLREDVLTLVGPGSHTPGTAKDAAGIPVTACLAGWAHYVAHELGWHAARHPDGYPVIDRWADPWPRRGHTADGWSAWLIAYLPQAACRPWIREMHHELDALLSRVRAITRIQPWTRVLDAPCPDCGAYGLTEAWGRLYITCSVCRHELTPEAYREHAAQLARTALRLITTKDTAPGHDLATG